MFFGLGICIECRIPQKLRLSLLALVASEPKCVSGSKRIWGSIRLPERLYKSPLRIDGLGEAVVVVMDFAGQAPKLRELRLLSYPYTQHRAP